MDRTSSKKSGGCIILFIAIALGVAGYFIYNLPYFKEKRAYSAAMESEYAEDSYRYIRMFPDGKNVEEVRWHAIETESSAYFTFEYAMEYLELFPQGKYADQVREKAVSALDEDLAHYTNRDLSQGDPAGVAFMQQMIKYMHDNCINDICIEVIPNIDVKNLSDYGYDVSTAMSKAYTDDSYSFTSKLLPMREQFEGKNLKDFNNQLHTALYYGMKEVFTNSVVDYKEDDECTPEMPKIKVIYTLKNQEVRLGGKAVPEVWEYTENNVTKNYLLGLSADYMVEMSIPGSDATYIFKAAGDPGEQIRAIDNVNQAYTKMARKCFEDITNKFFEKICMLPDKKNDDNDSED